MTPPDLAQAAVEAAIRPAPRAGAAARRPAPQQHIVVNASALTLVPTASQPPKIKYLLPALAGIGAALALSAPIFAALGLGLTLLLRLAARPKSPPAAVRAAIAKAAATEHDPNALRAFSHQLYLNGYKSDADLLAHAASVREIRGDAKVLHAITLQRAGLSFGDITDAVSSVASGVVGDTGEIIKAIPEAVKEAAQGISDAAKLAEHIASEVAKIVDKPVSSLLDVASYVDPTKYVDDELQRLGLPSFMPTPSSVLAKQLWQAVDSGDWQKAREIVKGQIQVTQTMVSYIPGVGTGASEALGEAYAIVDGGNPIEMAIEAVLGLPPFANFPPTLKQLIDAVVQAVIKIAGGDHVTDIMMVETKRTLPKGPAGFPGYSSPQNDIIADLFDLLVQVIFHHKPIIAVAANTLQAGSTKQITDALPDGPIKDAVSGAASPKEALSKLDDAIAKTPEPARSKLVAARNQIQARADGTLDQAQSNYRQMVDSAKSNFTGGAVARGVHAQLPSIDLQQTLRDAAECQGDALTCFHAIVDAQRTLWEYGRPDMARLLDDQRYQLGIGTAFGTFLFAAQLCDTVGQSNVAPADLEHTLGVLQRYGDPEVVAALHGRTQCGGNTDPNKGLIEVAHDRIATAKFKLKPRIRLRYVHADKPLGWWTARYTPKGAVR